MFQYEEMNYEIIKIDFTYAIVDKMNRAAQQQDYSMVTGELQEYYAKQLPAIPLYASSGGTFISCSPCTTNTGAVIYLNCSSGGSII